MKILRLIVMNLVVLTMVFGFTASAQAVGDNLAFMYGTASQSSDTEYLPYVDAGLAIDGNTDGDYWHGSVTVAGKEYMPWWQVDLGSEFYLESIMIWNRTDGAIDRLSDFSVSIMDASMSEVWGEDYYTEGGYPDPSLGILLPAMTNGQFVKVQLHDENYLSLAEVQVYEAVVVPEPISSTLFIIGVATLGFARFRKNS